MSSRQKILDAVRRREAASVELPSLAQAWIAYSDVRAQFAAALQSVGGLCITVERRESIAARLAEHPAFAAAKKIVSLVPGVDGNVDLSAVDDPHALEDVDFAVMPGEFGVAENGAVWVTDRGVRQRTVFFLVQHLFLVVDARSMVNNMHEAYDRLAGDAELFRRAEFGAFISGPSKTADIEQSLVIGAHGPRSLAVVLLASDE